MTPALRWAAMRAILMFHNCEGQSHKTVSTDYNFWREKESRSRFEPRSFSVLTSLTPYRLAKPAHRRYWFHSHCDLFTALSNSTWRLAFLGPGQCAVQVMEAITCTELVQSVLTWCVIKNFVTTKRVCSWTIFGTRVPAVIGADESFITLYWIIENSQWNGLSLLGSFFLSGSFSFFLSHSFFLLLLLLLLLPAFRKTAAKSKQTNACPSKYVVMTIDKHRVRSEQSFWLRRGTVLWGGKNHRVVYTTDTP